MFVKNGGCHSRKYAGTPTLAESRFRFRKASTHFSKPFYHLNKTIYETYFFMQLAFPVL